MTATLPLPASHPNHAPATGFVVASAAESRP
jgi:hypothetical protein